LYFYTLARFLTNRIVGRKVEDFKSGSGEKYCFLPKNALIEFWVCRRKETDFFY